MLWLGQPPSVQPGGDWAALEMGDGKKGGGQRDGKGEASTGVPVVCSLSVVVIVGD